MDDWTGGLIVGLFIALGVGVVTGVGVAPANPQYTYIRPAYASYCVTLNVMGLDPDLRCNLPRDAAGKMSDAINALMGAPK